jgi:hypothetical protein
MSVSIRVGWITLLAKLLIVCLAVAGMGVLSVQPSDARIDRFRHPRIGQSVTLENPLGDRQLQVTVTDFTDTISVQGLGRRGFRFVAAHLELANRGLRPFQVDSNELVLLDDAGLYAYNLAGSYMETSLKDFEPLEVGRLTPGETRSGWLVFEVPSVAKPAALIYLGGSLPPYFGVLAWINPAPPNPDGNYQILQPWGAERGSISVDYILPGLETLDLDVEAQRGRTVIGLVVTITNRSDERWRLPDANFWIVDQFGQFYPRIFLSRATPAYLALPDLGLWANPGESVQGVLMFEVPTESQFRNFIYSEENAQMYILGGPDPSLTITGEDALDHVTVTRSQSVPVDQSCVGMAEWAEASVLTLMVASDALADARVGIELELPELVRDAVARLEHARDFQGSLDIPESAQELQDGLLKLYQMTIDGLNRGIKAMDTGHQLSDEIQELVAANSPIPVLADELTMRNFSDIAECAI